MKRLKATRIPPPLSNYCWPSQAWPGVFCGVQVYAFCYCKWARVIILFCDMILSPLHSKFSLTVKYVFYSSAFFSSKILLKFASTRKGEGTVQGALCPVA